MRLKVKLDSGSFVPKRAHRNDAGLDLFGISEVIVPANGMAVADTGCHAQIPIDHVGFVKSKSSLMLKGITTDGTIDCGYTGSIRVVLFNHSNQDVMLQAGQKIAQLVILPIVTPTVEIVAHLDSTERGDGGFGSTGKF
jgi:dUTP pyrophosphatase